ncbi:DegT/DnrJ/EryC1/StrS family aminotransferase [Methylocapsa polymorpha]|uniref:DegT/DnrJ/EryC1/StrS family aminotransferase n=1 Tax=Methylocapsa polymorpha TaxID=3080828 RepID=A0ABZ0HRB0_9HYPH|nr:DegT/DnrJ/EryC1/StrS family aminotransferase [Methylocapsa sp. RX1]
MSQPVPFYRHDLGRPELDEIADVFAGPILTTGDKVAQFERMFADYLGRRHALGVTSCTGAIHMSLLALDIGPGDEVITTPMTFIATATAIQEAGATPVFVDVEPDTGNLDAARVEAAITPRTRAILPVHLYGLMCDMRALREIADRRGLAIIEDCAHCVEGVRDGVRPGQLSDAACFSFYATKNLTCGEGGAVATDRDDLVDKLRLLRLHGMTKTAADRHREGYVHWDATLLGWKYNMDNIQAAILIPQLKRLDAKLGEREKLARRYADKLSEISTVRMPTTRADAVHARHLFPIWVGEGQRDRLIAELNKRQIQTVVNYRAIHLLTHFADALGHRAGDFPIAERMGDETVSLPFYPTMPLEFVDIVSDAVANILQAARTSGATLS